MKGKRWMVLAVLVLVVVINWSTIEQMLLKDDTLIGKSSGIFEVPEETGSEWEVHFCPRDRCGDNLIGWIKAGKKEVHCAFYDVDLEEVKDALVAQHEAGIEVKVVVDADNMEFWEGIGWVRNDTRTAIMHNKFCIVDDQVVVTGSFNPTFRGNEKNNNNLVVYQSKYLAENYEEEFSELWEGVFGKGTGVKHGTVVVDGKKIENYFCPEDWCGNKVLYVLDEAKESVHFMTFSFTHDEIGEKLIELHEKGIEVKGVFEKSQNNKYVEHPKMIDAGMDVRWDGNGANMHHKVFIIDSSIVVTGSFNPSRNGDERNDENVLIIHDPAVAELFIEEFERVWEDTQA